MEREVKSFSKSWQLVERAESFEVQDSANRTLDGAHEGRSQFCVESRCGAVALGRTYLLPPLSFGGASMVPPWLRFHIPLIGRVEGWRAGRPLDRATFPVPSASHAACGFPALRAPICFTPTLMGPILLGRLSARRVALDRR